MNHPLYRSLFGLALLLASGAVYAKYVVVMVSGDRFVCEKRFEMDKREMIHFKVLNGPEISVTKDKIAWYETAVANGEKPPAWARPLKKNVEYVQTTPRSSALRWGNIGEDLSTLRREGISWSSMASVGFLTYGVLLLALIVMLVLCSLMFWGLLGALGEPMGFWKTAGVVCLLILSSIVLILFSQYTPLAYIHTMVLGILVNFVVWSALVVWLTDCDAPAAILSVIISQGVLVLLGFMWIKFF